MGQACCDGITCGAGLRCDPSQTCASADVAQVAVGAGHTCSLLADGTVWCWGVDAKGFSQRVGIGAPVLAYPRPVLMTGLANVADLRAGEFHTCAKRTDGTVWCWGHNESGQLGDGSFVSSRIPVQVMGLSGVTAFDAGRRSSCAVGIVGGNAGLYCWGRGSVQSRTNDATALGGRLGNASVADAPAPVAVDLTVAASGGQTVRTVAVGGYHSCMVMSDNTVWCWGRNGEGALGNNTQVASRLPVQVDLSGITIPSGVTIDEVTCTDGRRKQASSCMRLSDGAVYCWGYDANGELGDGMTIDRTTPVPITTTDLAGAKPVEIVSGAAFRCLRTEAGEVWCWGDNVRGSLGTGDTPTDFLTPQKIPTLTGVTELDASHRTACAIDGAKQLYCWGANRRGNVMARPPQGLAEDLVFEPFRVVW
jgi:alpha-tubulin suppressor-like RCC1 family protein